jgi:hypothetical protein
MTEDGRWTLPEEEEEEEVIVVTKSCYHYQCLAGRVTNISLYIGCGCVKRLKMLPLPMFCWESRRYFIVCRLWL